MTTRAEMSAELHRMLMRVGATETQAADMIVHFTEKERMQAEMLAKRYREWEERIVVFAEWVRERRLQDENTAET